MKKHSYLLLELLIAFNLFVVGCLPLIKIPVALYEKKKKIFQSFEKKRLSDLIFSDLFHDWLLKNSFPQDFLKKQKLGWTDLEKKKYPYVSDKKYPLFYRMAIIEHGLKRNPSTKQATAMMVQVDISLEKSPEKEFQTYFILLTKKNLSKPNNFPAKNIKTEQI
jgi:hypothetical protein